MLPVLKKAVTTFTRAQTVLFSAMTIHSPAQFSVLNSRKSQNSLSMLLCLFGTLWLLLWAIGRKHLRTQGRGLLVSLYQVRTTLLRTQLSSTGTNLVFIYFLQTLQSKLSTSIFWSRSRFLWYSSKLRETI